MAKKRDRNKVVNIEPELKENSGYNKEKEKDIKPIYNEIDKEIKITINKNNSIFIEHKDTIREDTTIKFKDNKLVIGNKEIEINKDVIINIR